MGKIQVLSDDVINKISAGEVVERPANIIKELVENSIDSGADSIKIELEEGGIKKISIEDNGTGIFKQDVPLALTRHATSKIRSVDDLFEVETLGFRGEALASIASVSKFTLLTWQKDEPVGSKYQKNFAESDSFEDWAGFMGTKIVVEDLFYNVPVRKKFLKSGLSEFAYCNELVQAIALINPGVSFSLMHNGKEKFFSPALCLDSALVEKNRHGFVGEDIFRQRAKSIFGEKISRPLLYFKEENSYGAVEALVSPPGTEKATSKYMYTFVNHRWVKDKTVRFGVMRGYHSHLLKGKFPIALVNMKIEPSLVDVNVHPAKTELRFQYSGEIQGLLATGIRKVIRESEWGEQDHPSQNDLDLNGAGSTAANEFSSLRTSTSLPDISKQGFSESRSSRSFAYSAESADSGKVFCGNAEKKRPDSEYTDQKRGFSDLFSRESERKLTRLAGLSALSLSTTSSDQELNASIELKKGAHVAIVWEDLSYLGTFQKCYLLFESDKKLLTIDQHAFHERIQYEKLCNNKQLLLTRQPMMVPEVVELDAKQMEWLQEHQDLLKSCGFSVHVLDHQSVEVKAVPAILTGRSLDDLFADLCTAENKILDSNEQSRSILNHLLATFACHSAVRAGEYLSEQEIMGLISEAKNVDFYLNCPHGRRVFKWFSKNQVESWFDR